jgi:hypothetical protein
MVRKRTRRFVARSVRFLAVPLVLAGVAAAAGIAPAGPAVASVASVAAQARIGEPRTFIPFGGQFNGAAVTSSGVAWAVGLDSGPLAQYWNGKTWTAKSTLGLKAPDGTFYSVAATSPGNAWAVGFIPGSDSQASLIARWNGKAWKRVSSPNPGPEGTILTGVTATSATNAWAVGSTGAQKTVIEHWNGKSWARVASPSPGTYDQLWAVTATSASNAWAVGMTQNTKDAEELHTLILHWNGKTWSQVASPTPTGLGVQLYGVKATSATNAWAVGYSAVYSEGFKSLILHWNGKVWAQVPSPDPVTVKSNELTWNLLQGVTATSASNAWAVGYSETSLNGSKTMILHWNGKTWAQVPSPNPSCSTCDSLYGVAAGSASSAWAVGTVNSGGIVVLLHWNGKHWVNFQSANALR